LSNQQRGRIASLTTSRRAGEDGPLWKKADGTWGTDGKVVVIETSMPFLQDHYNRTLKLSDKMD